MKHPIQMMNEAIEDLHARTDVVKLQFLHFLMQRIHNEMYFIEDGIRYYMEGKLTDMDRDILWGKIETLCASMRGIGESLRQPRK